MDPDLLAQEKQAIVDKYGGWVQGRLHLGGGVYTRDEPNPDLEVNLRRIVQIIADAANKPFDQLRIIDFGCLEGLESIELAHQGAAVVGIEGRERNVVKAEFAKRALSLSRAEFHLEDVRNVTRARYGEFDVVLCMGILYHLDAPDVFEFLEQVADMCSHFAIIDTHFSFVGDEVRTYNGRRYYGASYQEHPPSDSREQRLARAWASLDNPRSFWFTRPSLFNVLAHVGFTSVLECYIPAHVNQFNDRTTLLAFKGKRQALRAFPVTDAVESEDWPERRPRRLSRLQIQRRRRRWSHRLVRALSGDRQRWPYRLARTVLPPPARKAIREHFMS
ncbi:MAG TPA: methyltransferase domain-containing protein [Chloroflexota bacterium]|nr:methyltransferase domain-containing protein [Chloroflexota bacterium]